MPCQVDDDSLQVELYYNNIVTVSRAFNAASHFSTIQYVVV